MQPLTWEPPYAASAALKKKEKKNTTVMILVNNIGGQTFDKKKNVPATVDVFIGFPSFLRPET